MRRRTLALIAGKELLDTLRDRRTLFVALVLPLLLYPALLLGLTQIIGFTQRNLAGESQKILIAGDGEPLEELLRKHVLDPATATEGEEAELRAEALRLQGDEGEGARGRLREILIDSGHAGALLLDPGFGALLREEKPAPVELLFDPTDEPSRTAQRKVKQALDEFAQARREELRRQHPEAEQRLRYAERPVEIEVREIASESQKGAYSFAPMLGLLIVIMALTGAFYPAVDLAAGEKERGTMETLLVAPVTRAEIVVGKFLAIWAIAMVTALLNLAVMGLTFSKLAGMVGGGRVSFAVGLPAIAAVTLILIPTAALFSAVGLALSSLATSYKEGQHYLSPIFLVASPLAMVALLPNIEIGYGLALVPVSNVVLLVKAMLLGGKSIGPALVATLATAGYAMLALRAAVAVFRRESMLFRAGHGKSYDSAALRASRAGLPGEGHAWLVFFAVLALMFFLSGSVETLGDALRAFLLAQAALLLPTLAVARLAKVRMRETFRLLPFRPSLLPAIPVAAAATLLLVLAAYRLMPARTPGGIERLVGILLEDAPKWAFFACLAILPPICEELLCRGFLLSAFRSRLGAAKAVVLTALLFGALHLDLHRFPGTFAAGLVLGYVCVRTGSVFASILFHMVYNGLLASAVWFPAVEGVLAESRAWLIAASALALAAALGWIERRAARD